MYRGSVTSYVHSRRLAAGGFRQTGHAVGRLSACLSPVGLSSRQFPRSTFHVAQPPLLPIQPQHSCYSVKGAAFKLVKCNKYRYLTVKIRCNLDCEASQQNPYLRLCVNGLLLLLKMRSALKKSISTSPGAAVNCVSLAPLANRRRTDAGRGCSLGAGGLICSGCQLPYCTDRADYSSSDRGCLYEK